MIDVLFLSSIAAGVAGPSDHLRIDISLFEIDETPPHRTRPSTLSLSLMVGPGDTRDPVIAIGFPGDFF